MRTAGATIPELFRTVAALHPHQVAVKWRGNALSYRELDRRSDALARSIHDAGIKRGSNIGLMIPRSADAVIAMLGILKAGCAYVPIDDGYPEAVIADYLTRSDAAAVVVRAGATLPFAIDRLPRLSPDYFSVADEARPISAGPAGPQRPAHIVFTP